jgi:hypothetical protein
MRTVPRRGEVYSGICLTTEEKARKNLSQGSRRMPVGTMKTEYTEQSIQTIRIHNLQNLTQVYKTYSHINNDKKEPKEHYYTAALRYTSPHFTQLHITTLSDTSLPLIYTSLPSHLAEPNYISYRSISPHITKLDTVQFSHLQIYFQNNETLHCPKEPLTISLHFTFFPTYPINPSLHFNLLFMLIISTTHFSSLPFTFYRLHFPSLVFTFPTLVLKICVLPWEVSIAPSGSWFQSVSISRCLFFVFWL